VRRQVRAANVEETGCTIKSGRTALMIKWHLTDNMPLELTDGYGTLNKNSSWDAPRSRKLALNSGCRVNP
jgi:hypothetical protein